MVKENISQINFENKDRGSDLWSKYVETRKGESPEYYLNRALTQISSTLLIDEKYNDIDVPSLYSEIYPLLFEKYKQIGSIPSERMDIKDIREQFSVFKDKIHAVTNRIIDAEDKFSYFSQTIRDRDLLDDEDENSASIFRIFGIPTQFSHKGSEEYEIVSQLIKNEIKDKVIYILGGGNSGVDFFNSDIYEPKQIINIDPYLNVEPSEKNQSSKYISIPVPAESPDLLDNLEKENVSKPDEVWATFSVPCYLETSDQIYSLFNNINKILTKGGIVRIYPIALANFTNESSLAFNAEPYSERKDAWIQAVKGLVSNNNYNIEVISSALRLERL